MAAATLRPIPTARASPIASWLAPALGPRLGSDFGFAGRGKTARQGSAFLSLIETGRLQSSVGRNEASLWVL